MKQYIDVTTIVGAFGWIGEEGLEIIPAGTTVYAMSVGENCEEYYNCAEKYDVRFIFDDAKPIIDFYTIPWLDIFAKDSHGGFFATFCAQTDMTATAPICYIDKEHQCFRVSDSLKAFLQMVSATEAWRICMEPMRDIMFFSSSEEAKSALAFWEPPEIPKNHRKE